MLMKDLHVSDYYCVFISQNVHVTEDLYETYMTNINVLFLFDLISECLRINAVFLFHLVSESLCKIHIIVY